MSLAYVTRQACTTGSSGRTPSARSHTRWLSDGVPLRFMGSPSTYRTSIGRGRS